MTTLTKHNRQAVVDAFMQRVKRIGCDCSACRAIDIVEDMYSAMTIRPWWSTIVDQIVFKTVDRLARGHL